MKILVITVIYVSILFSICHSQSRIEVTRQFDIESVNTILPLLGQITTAVFDRTGMLFLADKSSNRIYQFNRDGKFVKSIGGPGEGPGEFNSCESIAITVCCTVFNTVAPRFRLN